MKNIVWMELKTKEQFNNKNETIATGNAILKNILFRRYFYLPIKRTVIFSNFFHKKKHTQTHRYSKKKLLKNTQKYISAQKCIVFIQH